MNSFLHTCIICISWITSSFFLVPFPWYSNSVRIISIFARTLRAVNVKRRVKSKETHSVLLFFYPVKFEAWPCRDISNPAQTRKRDRVTVSMRHKAHRLSISPPLLARKRKLKMLWPFLQRLMNERQKSSRWNAAQRQSSDKN